MLIKMGKAPKEVLEKGITLHQAAGRVHVTRPALLATLSTSKTPVRAWQAFDRTGLVFAETDIMAFAKVAKGFHLAPEEVDGAKKWLDYVAQSTTLVPEFHEVYSENLGHVDCTFSYADAVFWASLPGYTTLSEMLEKSPSSEKNRKGLLTQVRGLGESATLFYMSENLSAFDAPLTSLLEVAEMRAGAVFLPELGKDYLTSMLPELMVDVPLLTALVSGDVATLRSFVAETISMSKPIEHGLATQILEVELPKIPRWKVSKLWDGDYGFSNPLWIYLQAVENIAELVMRFT